MTYDFQKTMCQCLAEKQSEDANKLCNYVASMTGLQDCPDDPTQYQKHSKTVFMKNYH
jgi:hypothetical protein